LHQILLFFDCSQLFSFPDSQYDPKINSGF